MATPTPVTQPATRRAPSSAPAAPAQLIDLKEVCRRAGLGRTSIQKLLAAGKFPRPLKDPDIRATRWSAAAVEAWIQDRIAAADARR